MLDANRFLVWETNGKTFVAHEHPPVYDETIDAHVNVTLDVVTKKGLREIGAAINIVEAHALSRRVIIPYKAPEDRSEVYAMIQSGARNDANVYVHKRRAEA
jgi:hypothetical protein